MTQPHKPNTHSPAVGISRGFVPHMSEYRQHPSRAWGTRGVTRRRNQKGGKALIRCGFVQIMQANVITSTDKTRAAMGLKWRELPMCLYFPSSLINLQYTPFCHWATFSINKTEIMRLLFTYIRHRRTRQTWRVKVMCAWQCLKSLASDLKLISNPKTLQTKCMDSTNHTERL